MAFFDEIKQHLKNAIKELFDAAGLKKEDILVIGCSSSEISGEKIGTASSEEIGKIVFETINEETKSRGIYLAAQCCEHLNRALVLEEACADKYGFYKVNAVPQVKAGGSFATAAYKGFEKACIVETVLGMAAAGMDIGDTIIGMHLRPVVVPVRASVKTIGSAHLVCARTRPKYIGGERAIYNSELG